MNDYINDILNIIVPENKGYKYLRTENIFIPVYKISLSITKRRHTSLSLIEEMVLRIVQIGVSNIDEISGILGIDKNILNITIGDLYEKDLLYPSSNRCYIMDKGSDALRDLVTSKREKDTIRNIYVNAINSDITNEQEQDIVNRYLNKDCTLHHIVDGNNIEFYRSKTGIIRSFFEKENEMFTVDGRSIPDELVSIDEVEDLKICYIKMPVYIYISETGTDIDIMTCKKLNSLLDNIKGIVIDQIRNHRLLKNLFKSNEISTNYTSSINYNSKEVMLNLIKKFINDPKNQNIYAKSISDEIFKSRELVDNEFEKLCKYIFSMKYKVNFYIDTLDYWTKETSFITLLSTIPLNIKYNIFYNSANNLTFCEKRLKTSIPNLTKSNIISENHNKWFKMQVDNLFNIYAIPTNYKVFDNNTYIVKINYFIENVVNKIS